MAWYQNRTIQAAAIAATAAAVIAPVINHMLSRRAGDTPVGVASQADDDDLGTRILRILAEPNEGNSYSDTTLALRLNAHPDDVAASAQALAGRGLIQRFARQPQDDHAQYILDTGRAYLVEVQ